MAQPSRMPRRAVTAGGGPVQQRQEPCPADVEAVRALVRDLVDAGEAHPGVHDPLVVECDLHGRTDQARSPPW